MDFEPYIDEPSEGSASTHDNAEMSDSDPYKPVRPQLEDETLDAQLLEKLREQGIEVPENGPSLRVQVKPFPVGDHLDPTDIESVFSHFGTVNQVGTEKEGTATV